MLKKTPSILFYISILTLFTLLASYAMHKIEIIELINYIFYVLAFIFFFLTWTLSLKFKGSLRWTILLLSSLGSMVWLLGLFKYLNFEHHWNWSFSLMASGLLLALSSVCNQHTTTSFARLNFASLVLLIGCIYLTGNSYFESYWFIIISLSLYTLTALTSYFIKSKRVKA